MLYILFDKVSMKKYLLFIRKVTNKKILIMIQATNASNRLSVYSVLQIEKRCNRKWGKIYRNKEIGTGM